jgi:hypothetical protein
MTLSCRQERLVRRADRALCRSDPHLASMLSIFARLSAAERMPAREQLWPPSAGAWHVLCGRWLPWPSWLSSPRAARPVPRSMPRRYSLRHPGTAPGESGESGRRPRPRPHCPLLAQTGHARDGTGENPGTGSRPAGFRSLGVARPGGAAPSSSRGAAAVRPAPRGCQGRRRDSAAAGPRCSLSASATSSMFLRQRGRIVGMTAVGVNGAPAPKKAERPGSWAPALRRGRPAASRMRLSAGRKPGTGKR